MVWVSLHPVRQVCGTVGRSASERAGNAPTEAQSDEIYIDKIKLTHRIIHLLVILIK